MHQPRTARGRAIVEMLARGELTIRQIAERMRVGPDLVRSYQQGYRIPAVRELCPIIGKRSNRRARIQTAIAQAYNLLAAEHGVSVDHVRRIAAAGLWQRIRVLESRAKPALATDFVRLDPEGEEEAGR